LGGVIGFWGDPESWCNTMCIDGYVACKVTDVNNMFHSS
jgi:hypothetical protein